LEDLSLVERVKRALRVNGYGPLRCIEVAVQSRLVILRGRVPSYYLKQIAQTVALAVLGTHQVRNDLNVS
jgi:osmotically-inducible protein OsmY